MFDNLSKKDKYYLLFITIFSCILVGYYINFNNNIGIFCSDVYIYLLNSLHYNGENIANTQNLYLSPLICFITSLFFKIGFVDKNAIYIVTGVFAIFGNIGLYFLLKRFFNENLSLCGCIIYSSLPLYLIWLANGTLDVPAVSMIIWIGLFTILAVDENPKYYTPLILLIVLGIFTRYTVLLTIPAFILYYIFKKGFKIKRNELKYILIGIIIGAILIALTLGFILPMSNGSFGAENQISDGINGNQGSHIDPAYNSDISYYIINIPNFISNSHSFFNANPVLENPTILSWVIIVILAVGMCIWIYDHKRKFEKKDIYPIIFFILAIITFTKTSSVITTILVLVGLYLMGKDSPNKNIYFMLGWIFSNIIFISYYNIKVNRYFLPVFVPIIYFILLSIENIEKHFKFKRNIITPILIALFILQAFIFPLTFDLTDEYSATEDVSNYIIANNPDYKNMTIGVYNIRPFSWWLGKNITGIVSDNETAIDESNATYYISNRQLTNISNYTPIENFGKIYLYEKSV